MAKRNLFEELKEGIEEVKSSWSDRSYLEDLEDKYLALKRLKSPGKCWAQSELEQDIYLEG
jgi:hypothetical protein